MREVCFREVSREKPAAEVLQFFFVLCVSFFFQLQISTSLCRVCGLIETCPACCLPLTSIAARRRRLPPRYQRSSARPIPLSLESQGVLWRTKRKVNLRALVQRGDESLSSSEAQKKERKKISLFLLFCFSLQHFVIFENTQEHQRYF